MTQTLTTKREHVIKESLQRCRRDKIYFADKILGINLAGKQADAVNLGGRVSAKVAGRRFGKSLTTLIDMLHECATKKQQRWYVTAPSIDQAKIYFSEIEQLLGNPKLPFSLLVPEKKFKLSPFPEVELINGSKIMARSTARDGIYLRGKGADGVVITEAAFVKDRVYTDVIRAMVLDRKGRIRAETTPNGSQGYVYQLYKQGLSDASDYYRSFHATAYDNARLDKNEIEQIRKEIPELAFRVEYLAEFVDDDAVVFPWSVLQEIFDDYLPKAAPETGRRYTIGVDLAKYQDYTVITVLDVTQPPFRLAEWHRYRGKLYGDIVAQVNRLQEKYRATVYLDATGLGDPVAEQVKNCYSFVFTQRSREELISNLIVQTEQKRLILPAGNTALRDELRFFQRVRHGTNVRPEAPQGGYDDCVMSLALACWPMRKPRVTGPPKDGGGITLQRDSYWRQ